jgi:hypothetical protein
MIGYTGATALPIRALHQVATTQPSSHCPRKATPMPASLAGMPWPLSWSLYLRGPRPCIFVSRYIARAHTARTHTHAPTHCHTLVFKRRPESSYVCPESPHIQQKNRNIRYSVIYGGNIFIITLTNIRVRGNSS